MTIDLIFPLINPALLLSILFLYRKSDNRFNDLLYGWLFGLVTLAGVAKSGFLGSATLTRLNDFSLIVFWLLSLVALAEIRGNDRLAPAGPLPGVSGGALGRENALTYNLLGMILGGSPANYPLIALFGGLAADPARSGAGAGLILFFFFSLWLVLTIRGHFFEPPLVFLGLAAVNLPYVLKQLSSFMLDLVHEVFHLYSIVLLLPDHPYTRLWWYKTVNFILHPAFSAGVTVVLLSAPAVLLLVGEVKKYRQERRVSGPAARRERAIYRSFLRRQTFFALVFLLTVGGIANAGLRTEAVRDPAPNPVVIDRGAVVIAESNPFNKIKSETITKYAFNRHGRRVTFMVIKRGGAYKAALDACPVCADQAGYSQAREGHLVCNLCRSAVPLPSFGTAGGCNPIPLRVTQEPAGLSIELKEIDEQLKNIGTKKTTNK